MPTYAIGDIQGCHATLRSLLDRIRFDPARDRLWLTGDLVNRGPASLEVLRWARGLGDRAIVVLGNHDLRLLAVAAGVARLKDTDTLGPVLTAPDRDSLLAWLARRPLFYREGRHALVHAGLLPAWSWETAAALAAEAERRLATLATSRELLQAWKRKKGLIPYRDDLAPAERVRTAIAVFSLLRTVTPEGRPCLSFAGPPHQAPPGCRPWFAYPERDQDPGLLIHGHWATLGLHRTAHTLGLDTGCVWGGTLTAYRLEDEAVFEEPVCDSPLPGPPA
jgi:bis(5'-nucleosyl)-tetraphosphatase (symmetrical)